MMAIPRANIGLRYGELFRFIAETLLPRGVQASERRIAAFEQAFAARYGEDCEGVVCCKARMAFYHTLNALGLAPGSEIIISAIHIADYVNMIRLAGFTPVAVDLQSSGYDISLDDLRAKITAKTGIILVTHLSGYPCDMDGICAVAAEHGIPVVEDCSQAVSAKYKGRRLGTFGEAAIFSLSLLKPVCTMSGGMIVTRNRSLLEKLRASIEPLPRPARLPLLQEAVKNLILKTLLSRAVFSLLVFPLLRWTLGKADRLSAYQKTNKTVILRDKLPNDFRTRFSYAQATLGLSQLETVEAREAKRIENARRLHGALAAKRAELLPRSADGSGNAYWLFPVILDDTEQMKQALARSGVDSSSMLLAVLSQEEAFQEYGFSCPNAERLRQKTLFVPMYASLSGPEIERVAGAIPEDGSRLRSS